MIEPYYSGNGVDLYLGDCREVLPTLDIAPDAAICDPPYGSTSLEWDTWPTGWLQAVAAVTSSMWCFGSLRMFLAHGHEFGWAEWRMSHDVVWQKQNGTGFVADRFKGVHELIVHWYRGAWSAVHHSAPRVTVGVRERDRSIKQGKGHSRHLGKIGDRGSWIDDGTRLATSVIEASNMWRRGAIHPTEKPVALLLPLIEYTVPPGGLVLDPMAGSCSTAVAARLTSRRAVCIEGHEPYLEAAARRLDQDVLVEAKP